MEKCKCPKCEKPKLTEEIDRNGGVRHECLSCGYLVHWTPRRIFPKP